MLIYFIRHEIDIREKIPNWCETLAILYKQKTWHKEAIKVNTNTLST